MIDFDFEKEVQRRFKLQKEYLDKDKIVNAKSPLVSVCIQTYNHEKYIIQCLDSILEQKTNFDFEIILGEDDSKDNTREICIEFANRYQDKIRLFLRDRKTTQLKDKKGNLLRRLNGVFTRMDARGKYIALCEGDDYWTDPLKLQKQVDFLEENEEYSMCFHKANVIDVDRGIGESIFNHLEERNYTGDEILEKWSVPTASVVYRNDISLKDVSKFKKNVLYGDILLFLKLADVGKLFCVAQEMSVYRLHTAGATNSKYNTHLRKIKHFKALKSIFYPKYKKTLNKFISNYSFLEAREAFSNKKYFNVLKYSIFSMWYSFSTFNYFFKKWTKQKQ